MRGLVAMAGIFALLAGCGYEPHPKDGKLPCTEGCPSGYVCRTGNRCWRANSPIIDSIDSGVDSGAAKDSAVPEVGRLDASAGMDGPALDADKDVPLDNNVAVDVGAGIDIAGADSQAPVDTRHIDGAGGSTVDAQRGTGGAGGGGGTSGLGGTSGGTGGGGASGTGGSTGGASGSGDAGGWDGSIPDAAPDAPITNSDAACVPETDQQMCTRLAKNCNAVTDFDNCGKSRLITSCGTCIGTLVCGAFVANVCPPICVLDQSALDQCVLGP